MKSLPGCFVTRETIRSKRGKSRAREGLDDRNCFNMLTFLHISRESAALLCSSMSSTVTGLSQPCGPCCAV